MRIALNPGIGLRSTSLVDHGRSIGDAEVPDNLRSRASQPAPEPGLVARLAQAPLFVEQSKEKRRPGTRKPSTSLWLNRYN